LILDFGTESKSKSLLDVLGILGSSQPAEGNVLLVVVATILECVVDDLPLPRY
jgi:hypothetical protein